MDNDDINDLSSKYIASNSQDCICNKAILAQRLSDCGSFNLSQNMIARTQTISIDTTDINYPDNAPICINQISYSYGSLGSILPYPFFLDNRPNVFDLGPIPTSQCTVSLIPDDAEQAVINALNSAETTFALSNAALSNLTTEERLNALYLAANSATNTNNLTSIALRDIISDDYPAPADVFQSSLVNTAQALLDHTEAEQIVSSLLGETVTSVDAQNVQAPLSNSNTLVINTANDIINSTVPAPSAEVIQYAQNAISAAQQSNDLIAAAVTTPSYEALLLPLIQSFSALSNLIDALLIFSLPTQSDRFILLVDSLGFAIEALFYTNVGLEAANSAFADPSNSSGFINTAASYFVNAANFDIDALELLISNLFTALLYNNFIVTIRRSENSCSNACGPNKCVSFIQEIPNYGVCNLNIFVCGTIGGQPFTGSIAYDNLNPITTLGFNQINLSTNFCIPTNAPSYTINETFDSSLVINSVVPISNYNSLNPDSFTVNIFSTLSIDVDISIFTTEPLLVKTNCIDN